MTRINKYLADHKYSTRKGADELISRGLVTINGRKAVLGDQVSEADIVTVDKKALSAHAKKYLYLAFNKPPEITTHKEKDAKSILESTSFPTGVFPVGRLDKDSHGLIILTNDGRVTDRLLNPKYDHDKEYRVSVDKLLTDSFLAKMKKGVRLGDGYTTKPCKVKKGGPKTFFITLTEGKNRQIRRMCEALHFHVTDLRRIRILNIEIENIKEGASRAITGTELEKFLKLISL